MGLLGVSLLAEYLFVSPTTKLLIFQNANLGEEGAKLLSVLLEEDVFVGTLHIEDDSIPESGWLAIARALWKPTQLSSFYIAGKNCCSEAVISSFAVSVRVNHHIISAQCIPVDSFRKNEVETVIIENENFLSLSLYFEALRFNSSVSTLCCTDCKFGASGLDTLSKVLTEDTSLRFLALENCNLEVCNVQTLRSTISDLCGGLYGLSLHGNHFSYTQVMEICVAFRELSSWSPNLQALALSVASADWEPHAIPLLCFFVQHLCLDDHFLFELSVQCAAQDSSQESVQMILLRAILQDLCALNAELLEIEKMETALFQNSQISPEVQEAVVDIMYKQAIFHEKPRVVHRWLSRYFEGIMTIDKDTDCFNKVHETEMLQLLSRTLCAHEALQVGAKFHQNSNSNSDSSNEDAAFSLSSIGSDWTQHFKEQLAMHKLKSVPQYGLQPHQTHVFSSSSVARPLTFKQLHQAVRPDVVLPENHSQRLSFLDSPVRIPTSFKP